MTTKKMLVAYNPDRPADNNAGDFLAPVYEGPQPRFIGLKSGKLWGQGRMVYVGREVTANDVFAKLVDTGRRIDDVEQTLRGIDIYLQLLQEHRIGNIVAIEASGAEPCGFKLRKIANTPHGKGVRSHFDDIELQR